MHVSLDDVAEAGASETAASHRDEAELRLYVAARLYCLRYEDPDGPEEDGYPSRELFHQWNLRSRAREQLLDAADAFRQTP